MCFLQLQMWKLTDVNGRDAKTYQTEEPLRSLSVPKRASSAGSTRRANANEGGPSTGEPCNAATSECQRAASFVMMRCDWEIRLALGRDERLEVDRGFPPPRIEPSSRQSFPLQRTAFDTFLRKSTAEYLDTFVEVCHTIGVLHWCKRLTFSFS